MEEKRTKWFNLETMFSNWKKITKNRSNSIQSSSNIIQSTFFVIPIPLWNQIIEYLKNDKESLKNLRLICKLFRNMVSQFWKQVIPDSMVSDYFMKIEKLDFRVEYFE